MKSRLQVSVASAIVICLVALPITTAFSEDLTDFSSNMPIPSSSSLVADGETEYYAVIAACSAYEDSSLNLPKIFGPFPEYTMRYVYDALLKAPNWKEENIILLINEEATREGILSALTTMSTLVDADDTFLFSWSGHGSRVIDEDEDERLTDPLDGYDEVICPYDCSHDEEGSLASVITDDELDGVFSDFSSQSMLLMFECCFSGGLVERQQEESGFSAVDIDSPGRIVIMSTPPDHIGRAMFLTGWGLMFGFGCAFKGLAQDKDRDGWISAEEAFQCAKNIYLAECSLYWFGIFMSNYFSHLGSDDDRAFLSSILDTAVSYVALYILTKICFKVPMMNWANMDDGHLGDLQIIQC